METLIAIEIMMHEVVAEKDPVRRAKMKLVLNQMILDAHLHHEHNNNEDALRTRAAILENTDAR